jgi:hypothetical protein
MRKEDRVRQLIAKEAARIMYEEGVREYRDAKRKASRQFGPEKALSLGSHLPSNAEIHWELQRAYQKNCVNSFIGLSQNNINVSHSIADHSLHITP